MKAAVYREFGGRISVEDMRDPVPSADGVVIKVLANGICRSDWHGWRGHDAAIELPHVPGHECCGEIVEVGCDVTRFEVGERVIVPFSGGCGSCPPCESGFSQICDFDFQPGFSDWGAFAEYCAVRYADHNLVKLPEGLSPLSAASLGCRVMTSYWALTDRVSLRDADWVVVWGCGGVGLSALLIARCYGARVIAVDVNERVLEFARKLGAVHALNPKVSSDISTQITELTGGGAQLSIDAIGSTQVVADSCACLAKRGTHLQVGLAVGEQRNMSIPMNIVIGKELRILGCHGMPAHGYPGLLSLVVSGKLNVEQLITEKVSLSESGAILSQMDSRSDPGIAVITKFD